MSKSRTRQQLTDTRIIRLLFRVFILHSNMKTPILKIVGLFLFSLCYMVSHAQHEWWPIHPGQVNYYKLDSAIVQTPQERVFGIYIMDSLQLDSEKRHLFNRYEQSGFGNCELDLSSGPFGRCQSVDSTGVTLYTYHQTPLRFSFLPQIGDTIVSIRLTPTLTDLRIIYNYQTVMNIYGTLDSVRIYSVLTEPHAPYYDSLILSKHYGIIRTPIIRRLQVQNAPIYTTQLHEWNITGTLQLTGNSHLPNNPVKRLTYLDCYTYEIGDIHHIEYRSTEKKYRTGSLYRTTNDFSISIQEVLTKTENVDSITYLIRNETYSSKEVIASDYYNYNDNTTMVIDTLIVSKNQHKWDITVPGTKIFDSVFSSPSGSVESFYYTKSINNLSSFEVYENHPVIYSYLDSCYNLFPDNSYSNQTLFYIENLGGPYYNRDVFFDLSDVGFKFERKLIYYKNSSGTWGTPYPFPLGLNKNTGDKASIINVYPNPANELFTIDSNKEKAITITDVTGKIVYENEKAKAITAIVCKDWPTGVYIVKCFSDSHYEINKIIIQH